MGRGGAFGPTPPPPLSFVRRALLGRGSARPDMLPDCLSTEGEQRCRQLLTKATARLRARPAAAAVLVPLCSVQGVPALLYTLRSSRLAGRHKGDVRYTAGKALFLLEGGCRTPETAGTLGKALSLSEPRFPTL